MEASPGKTSFTYELSESEQELLLGVMLSGNYRKREVPYSLWSVEGQGFNATLYEKEKHGKRKLCIQGKGAEDFVLFTLEPQVLKRAELGYEEVLHPENFAPHAGSDESGKGDFFGPLVVCCCYTDESLSRAMKELGARDCKQMSDAQVLKVGAQLRELLTPARYSVVKLGNAAYNRLYAKMRNINRMLAWAHATAIEDLLEKIPSCPRVVVDQFARTEAVIASALKPRGKKAELVQMHKAESDIAVAAASVIARELFLRDMQGGNSEDRFPVGSSDPKVKEFAIERVKAEGPNYIMNHCKAHFRTTDQVLEACGFSRRDLPPEGQVTNAVSQLAS
jgi:ribonuclease HIII